MSASYSLTLAVSILDVFFDHRPTWMRAGKRAKVVCRSSQKVIVDWLEFFEDEGDMKKQRYFYWWIRSGGSGWVSAPSPVLLEQCGSELSTSKQGVQVKAVRVTRDRMLMSWDVGLGPGICNSQCFILFPVMWVQNCYSSWENYIDVLGDKYPPELAWLEPLEFAEVCIYRTLSGFLETWQSEVRGSM